MRVLTCECMAYDESAQSSSRSHAQVESISARRSQDMHARSPKDTDENAPRHHAHTLLLRLRRTLQLPNEKVHVDGADRAYTDRERASVARGR